MTIEEIAQVAHKVNRSLCLAAGDRSQKHWHEVEPWQRESAIQRVKFVLDNPEATPEQTHEAWMQHKIKTGWVFGQVKDPATKTHPCLRPYNELPFRDRVKDYAFRAIVTSLWTFSTAPKVATTTEQETTTPPTPEQPTATEATATPTETTSPSE